MQDRFALLHYLESMIDLGKAVYERRVRDERIIAQAAYAALTGNAHPAIGRARVESMLADKGYICRQWFPGQDGESFLIGYVENEEEWNGVHVLYVDTRVGLDLRENLHGTYTPYIRSGNIILLCQDAIERRGEAGVTPRAVALRAIGLTNIIATIDDEQPLDS
jgi:hypothetical protein